jgi:hypothetical protein
MSWKFKIILIVATRHDEFLVRILSPDRDNMKSDTSTIMLVCLDAAPEQLT